MKKLLTTLFVLTLVTAVFTGPIFAHNLQRQMGHYNNDHHYNSETRNYNRIELSQDQIDQIAKIREDFYNQTEEIRTQIRDLKYKLNNLEFRGASRAEIGEVEDQIEELLIKMDEKRANNQEKMESVLTEKQLDLLAENRSSYDRGFTDDSARGYSDQMFLGHHNNFGPGMMGMMHWGSFENRDGNRNNRDYNRGYGSGWCH